MTATLPADVVTQLGITEPGEILLDVVAINEDGSATVETEGGEDELDEEEPEAPVPGATEPIPTAVPAAVGAMIKQRRKAGPAY